MDKALLRFITFYIQSHNHYKISVRGMPQGVCPFSSDFFPYLFFFSLTICSLVPALPVCSGPAEENSP